jgi:hypothetical protein
VNFKLLEKLDNHSANAFRVATLSIVDLRRFKAVNYWIAIVENCVRIAASSPTVIR